VRKRRRVRNKINAAIRRAEYDAEMSRQAEVRARNNGTFIDLVTSDEDEDEDEANEDAAYEEELAAERAREEEAAAAAQAEHDAAQDTAAADEAYWSDESEADYFDWLYLKEELAAERAREEEAAAAAAAERAREEEAAAERARHAAEREAAAAAAAERAAAQMRANEEKLDQNAEIALMFIERVEAVPWDERLEGYDIKKLTKGAVGADKNLRKACIRLTKALHPDKLPDSMKARASAALARVNMACQEQVTGDRSSGLEPSSWE
jgi:hypothetical protein